MINKIDLLPYVEFDLNACIDYARRINPDIEVIQLSARTGEGMGELGRLGQSATTATAATENQCTAG